MVHLEIFIPFVHLWTPFTTLNQSHACINTFSRWSLHVIRISGCMLWLTCTYLGCSSNHIASWGSPFLSWWWFTTTCTLCRIFSVTSINSFSEGCLSSLKRCFATINPNVLTTATSIIGFNCSMLQWLYCLNITSRLIVVVFFKSTMEIYPLSYWIILSSTKQRKLLRVCCFSTSSFLSKSSSKYRIHWYTSSSGQCTWK